ncbi:hypothetical protein [Streptomyces sp. 769]|uniref:hypothetical protein n=1 Tax=Streptomyces sp. 769 TaxID=1262452 RepID=UPI00057FE084|nr:hypothetical protein [Streptomyces sp. 769]AJC60905.1 hypothetical protein GZL_08377 [Streptomyces sp. 769]
MDLLAPDGQLAAQITAVIENRVATADAVFHRTGVDARQLVALLVALIDLLRQEPPEATALDVQDLCDPVVTEALATAGLHVTERWHQYRLPLWATQPGPSGPTEGAPQRAWPGGTGRKTTEAAPRPGGGGPSV